jgi:chromate transport protein ChrA
MQADAVSHYHWLTASQFLYAAALGQITPGPVVQTVAVVGYTAAGLAGGLLTAFAFTRRPSYSSWPAPSTSTNSKPTPQCGPS